MSLLPLACLNPVCCVCQCKSVQRSVTLDKYRFGYGTPPLTELVLLSACDPLSAPCCRSGFKAFAGEGRTVGSSEVPFHIPCPAPA